MADKTHRLEGLLKKLRRIIASEQNAISDRKFDIIARLTVDKSGILEEFDAAMKALDEDALLPALKASLDEIRLEAEINARQLEALMQGVRIAREKLSILRAREFDAGAYSADGDELRAGVRSTMSATF